MILTDLFRGYRRSEPTILLVLKLFMMIILVACMTGYLAIVIIDVKHDAPVIRTSFVDYKTIRPPNLIFTSQYNFTMTCFEGHYKINDTNPILVNCLPDITNPDGKYGSTQQYYGIYQPSQDVNFSNFNKSNDYSGIMNIMIGLIIIDTNYNPGKIAQTMLEMNAFDSDYDPITKYIKEKRYNELSTPEVIDATSVSTASMNKYILVPSQYFQFTYHRKIEEFIKPSWMNDFGIPPDYETRSYIESNLWANPLLNNNLSSYMLMINIMPKSGIVEVDREIRTHTYLGGMGLIGGAWGLAAALYALLFGTDTLRPWGVVQLYCCGFSRLTRRKLNKTLPILPFFDASSTNTKDHGSNHGLSLAEKVDLISLQSRIDSLELFLREYVVDVRYLDDIRDKSVKSRATLNSTTDTMREEINNLNMNSTVFTTAVQQQQEELKSTIPSNSAQNSTTSTPRPSTNNISDTHDNLYDDRPRQQNHLT